MVGGRRARPWVTLVRLLDRPGPLVAATRRRSATVRILLFVLVVIVVATAIVWGLNESNRVPPGGTVVAGRDIATMPVPAAAASPTPAPRQIVVPTATAIPTATPTPSPSPAPSPSPIPTATALPTATPPPTMTPTPVVITGCAEPAAVPAVSGPTQFVAETGINLRERPGLTCLVVVPIQQFTEITALSGPVEADGLTWIRVEVAGFTGWVATDNLREPANG